MDNTKNREFVRTLHGMIADFLRDNPDIDRSYYQEIWDWLEKKEDEENEDEIHRKWILEYLYDGLRKADEQFKDHFKAAIAYLEKQKEQKPIINFPVFIEEKNIEQAIKKFLGESAKFQKEQTFTHHEIGESLQDAVTHQMEDDGDVDDFVRRGIDDIVLKYAEIGAKWQKEQKPAEWSEDGKKSFVDSGFLWCVSSFEDFKAGETYWLEYLSNDNYSVRSDNLLARTYHITPEQLYSHFYQYIEQKSYEPHNWPADKDNLTQEPNQEWSKEDEKMLTDISWAIRYCAYDDKKKERVINWFTYRFKSLLSRPKPSDNWKPTEEQLHALYLASYGGELSSEDCLELDSLLIDLRKNYNI